MPTKSYAASGQIHLFFEKQNENGRVNLQKNQESTKEHNSKCQKLKFVMTWQVANRNFQTLVASGTAVKCQKLTQVMRTS
jgi:predicted 3-demethylubiquinone-9 3-methyltransferase (glyoxalase superfamily)